MGAAADILAGIKSREGDQAECVHPLVDDAPLRNLVVIWSRIPVEFKEPKGPPPESDNARWLWLWEGARYNKDQIAGYLHMDRLNVGRMIEQARAFRLIYPDGTSNGMAIRFVRAEIARGIPGPGKRKVAP